MAGLNFSLPKFAGSNDGLTLQDKLLAFSAIAHGHPEVAMQLPQIAMQRRLYSQLLGDDAPGDGGTRSPTQAVTNSTDVQPGSVGGIAPLPQTDVGRVNIPQLGVSGPAPGIPQMAPPQAAARPFLDPGNPATARRLNLLALINPQAAQALARVQMATRPDMVVGADGVGRNVHDPNAFQGRISSPQFVDGVGVDLTDPNNVGRVLPKPPVAGAMPIYDGPDRKTVVDWYLPPGAQAAILGSQAETIRHNRTAEGIESTNAATGRMNAGTSAGTLSNTQTQNQYVPPPGFVVRSKR